LALVAAPLNRGLVVDVSAMIWAFLGGVMLMLDALRIRRQLPSDI